MFEIEMRGQGVVLLRGRLDASEAEKAIEVLRGLPGPIIADCSELDYISSAGIGVMVETHKRLMEAGHGLTLRNLTPRVRNVFTYAGLHKFLLIE
jgi:anti-sigma B factor antagonist